MKVTLTTHQRGAIARLKAEARAHRKQARRYDELARGARDRHDPLDALHWRSMASGRRREAKACDSEIEDIRHTAFMAALSIERAREEARP